ncbi:MAG: hypothetical protein ISQ73_17555, partial [Verrucomicrobiae bacterium]|nr:hypothetical protein [Verrucomicrobiae bacterium]
MRTWEYWVQAGSEGPVDLEHYQATGGMTEALSRHADEVFQSLPDGEHRRIATLIFKSLTEKVSENRGIRRPMQLNELHEICGGDIKHLLHVIDEFRKTGCTFLMPAGESARQKHTIIDISHESLMRVWRTLRLWVDDEAQSAKIYRRLADTASLFKDGKAGLYRHPDLGIALAWRDENQPNQTWADRYYPGFAEAMVFLDKSQAEEEREGREKEEGRKRELAQAQALANAKTRTARIFKAATIGIALLAILCLVAFLQATQSKRIAEEKEILASAYLYDAQISLASKAIQDGNQGKAKRLLARYKEKEITENQPSWEWRFLWNECKNDFKREIGSHKDIVNCIAISPSNNLIATGSADKTLKVINLETESETNFDFSASVTSAQFTEDEKSLFYINENEFGEIRLDSMSVTPTHIPISGGSSFEISGNGQWISVVSSPNLLIYNTITEEVITVKQAQARWDFSSGMSYSSDNKKLAWRGGEENPGIPIIYDLETKTISEFKNTPSALKTKSIMHLEFHPSNETIIATHWGGYVSRWDAIDMSYLSHFKAHNAWVSDIIFITNGEEFITSSADQSIKLWKTKDFSLGANMTGHTGEVWAIAASSDEQILYSTGKDHSIKEWEIKRFKEQSNEVSVTNNHVGSRLINGGINYFKLDDHNLFEVFESSSMERIFRKILPITHTEDGKFMGKANRLRFFAITPSHGLYAFINDKKELVVSDVEGTNDMIFVDDLSFESSNVWENNITFSTDGRLIKLFSDKGLSFYDAQSGDLTKHINLTNPSGISYSDDEKYGLFRANDESPFVYSFEKDKIISRLDLYNRFIPNAAFSKDGKYVATVSDDATTRLWEVATGKQLNIFRGQLLSSHDVAFTSDGKRLFVGNGEGTVKVWNTETGNELITIEANDGEIVSQVKLSNDQTLNVISGIEGLKYRKFEVSAFNNQNTDVKI